MAAEELFSAPSDLTLSSDTELAELETRAVAEFDRVIRRSAATSTPKRSPTRCALTEDLDRIRGELEGP